MKSTLPSLPPNVQFEQNFWNVDEPERLAAGQIEIAVFVGARAVGRRSSVRALKKTCRRQSDSLAWVNAVCGFGDSPAGTIVVRSKTAVGST